MRFIRYPDPTVIMPGDYYLSSPGILYILGTDHLLYVVDLEGLACDLDLREYPPVAYMTSPAPRMTLNDTYGSF